MLYDTFLSLEYMITSNFSMVALTCTAPQILLFSTICFIEYFLFNSGFCQEDSKRCCGVGCDDNDEHWGCLRCLNLAYL